MRIPTAGLWTNPNDFDAPVGSTEVLDNMTQERPGIWEPRRGFALLEGAPTITGPINAITSFRGNIIVHHSTASISRWTGSAWSTYSGTFTPPTQAAAGRPRFVVTQQSLFVTTTAGVYELDSPTGAWRLTGAPQALDSVATLRRTVSETGFATPGGQWAYRVEWGFKNANGRLQIGPPSGRFLVQSPDAIAATAANVSKTTGTDTVTVINTTHGFVTGEYVDVTLGGVETNFLAGTFQVTRVSDTSFTYHDGGSSSFTGNPGANITYGFTGGRNVSLSIPIPSGITVDYFAMVHRSAKSASATTEPNDQLAQVYERSPTNLEITAGSMTVVDLTPDDFRGALMDTSAETILAAKYRPPVCADLAEFHGSVFCAATIGLQTFDFQVIAVGGTTGLKSGEKLTFAPSPANFALGTWGVEIVLATTEDAPNAIAKVFTTGSASQNIANTAKSIVKTINLSTFNTKLYASYVSGDAEAPGKIRVYGRNPAVDQFAALVSNFSGVPIGTALIPTFIDFVGITDIARSGSTVTVNTSANHGFTSGQIVELQFSNNTGHFPNGSKTITVVDPNTFTYTEAGTAVAAEANAGLFLSAPGTDVVSDVISRTDRLAFGMPDQPWSVPLPNEMFIEGTPTTTSSAPTIFRLIPNRDRVYVWADSGLFQISGFYPDFVVTTIQTPLKMLAPESGVSQGTPGQAYALTDTGAVGVMTSPVGVSTAIQNIFQNLQVNAPAALKNYAFAVAYPSAFMVLFFLPEASTDVKATNAYVLHTRTGEWSRWDVDATCGFVDPVTDKLYLGRTDGAIWVERKSRTLDDYWDPGSSTPVAHAYTVAAANAITVTVVTGIAVGDTIKDTSTNTRTIVTAVNGSVLTVLSSTGFTAPGTLNVEKEAYTKTIRPTRWFGKEGPTVDKDVGMGMLFVEPPSSSAEFTTMTVAARNDYDPTFSTPETLTLHSVVTSQLPFNIPTNMQRSGWLQIQVQHSNGGERFRFLGHGFNYSKAGDKSP